MLQRFRLLTILAGLVTAAAWWVSRGVLDLVIIDGRAVRLAYLPGWEALLGFLLAAASLIGLVAIAHRQADPVHGIQARWVPLLFLAVLVVPYVPLLADAFTPLRLLAGPLRSAVWTVVLGVLAWILISTPTVHAWVSRQRRDWLGHAALSLIVLCGAVALLTATPIDGMEPLTPPGVGLRLTLLAALAWGTLAAARDATTDEGAALLSTVALVLSVPALQTLGAGGPALAVMSAVAVATAARPALLVGLSCGLLTWFGADIVPLALVLLLGRMAALVASAPTRQPERATLAAMVAPFVAMVGLAATGLMPLPVWWPAGPASVTAIDGASTSPVVVLAGLWLDQRHGLLYWVPVLWLLVAGVPALWQRTAEARVRLVTATSALLVLVVAAAGHAEWWGTDPNQPWPLAAALPLLAPLVAAGWSTAPFHSTPRAMRHALLWCGLWMSAAVLWTDATGAGVRGFPGLAPLLVWISPLNEAWRALPTFRHDALPTALVHGAVWLTVACGVAFVVRRLRPRAPGVDGVRALLGLASVVILASTGVSLWPHDAVLPGPRLEARSRLFALDGFDPQARPAALLYTPLTRMAASDTLPLLDLHVTPGLRSDPQPLRVLLNGRWSLPAGRYRVTVDWTPGAVPLPDTIGLQIGRTGPPLTTLDVGGAGGRSQLDLTLPADAVFVGLRGTTALEHALTRISVTPLSVIPAALRPEVPQVVGATYTPGGLVLVHTDTAGIDAGSGVWVMAGAPATISLPAAAPASATARSPSVTVRLRSDAPTNRVTLASRGWQDTVTLVAGVPLDVQIPRTGTSLTPLTISADSAFVPASHVPGSADRRPLGVWVTRPLSGAEPLH
ncbi:MAG: hypothetical protein FJW29_09475 [Acidobacteria bacterium]|nr:hypothetical protein [Acidobacteriota bacterium]